MSCKETGSVCHILAPHDDSYIGTFSSILPSPLVMCDCGKVDDRVLVFHFYHLEVASLFSPIAHILHYHNLDSEG